MRWMSSTASMAALLVRPELRLRLSAWWLVGGEAAAGWLSKELWLSPAVSSAPAPKKVARESGKRPSTSASKAAGSRCRPLRRPGIT